MNLTQKTNDWVAQKLITHRQQQSILTHERQVRAPYVALVVMWIGALCAVLGLASVVWAHWAAIPEGVKLTAAGVLLTGALCAAGVFVRQKRQWLAEVALFFAFLMIGGGIGLVAQIFNLPLHNEKGALIWAALSIGIVLISRHGMLSWLWIPLFVGGVLGFMKLELLLLFFDQSPLFATTILAGIFMCLAYMGSLFQNHFMQNVYRWSLALFFGTILLGDIQSTEEVAGFFLSAALLGLVGAFAVFKNKLHLFHLVVVFFGARLVVFYFQVFHSLSGSGLGLLLSGAVLWLAAGVWYLTHKEEKTG